MKYQTKLNDLRAYLAEMKCKAKQGHQLSALRSCVVDGKPAKLALLAAQEAVAANNEAGKAFAKIPPQRRSLAEKTADAAKIAANDALEFGGDYAGASRCVIAWSDKAEAGSHLSRGEHYGGAAKQYRKNDVEHKVSLDPAGVILLMDSPLTSSSLADGLPLIALYPDGSAVWVRRTGKRIESVKGWVVGDADACYHSTVSLEHAEKGLKRKLNAGRNKEERTAKENRRMLKLAESTGATATVGTARAMGFCGPGIQAFQEKHGFGDEVKLTDLLATGNPSAERLVAHVLKKIRKKSA